MYRHFFATGSRYGDVLITVATGKLTKHLSKKLGLVPEHAYAVLEVREVQGFRLVKLKNPWAQIRWKGTFSPYDSKNWTTALRTELQYDPSTARKVDNGIFWINYGSLISYFTGLYMNWNTELCVTSLPLRSLCSTREVTIGHQTDRQILS